ncbi:hypothetical protein [Flavobacterium sp. '19STA2R22 D10 B1']|uniref:hypothetical protein n=1 Tax=Flavobacterium aerium TaxID=3037261 RepID=UPI00278C44D3|nr:hypothetical protein [Flavobacterium sp. '19STA2R22 D10 B1']
MNDKKRIIDIMSVFKEREISFIDVEQIVIINDLFKNLSNEQRENIREDIKEDERLKILAFTEKLSVKAYETENISYLITALILISIEDFKWDSRESLIYLSIIWFVSEKIKSDSLGLFNEVINLSSEEGKRILLEFVSRNKQLKSLRAMGLKSTIKKNSISFDQIVPPWMN